MANNKVKMSSVPNSSGPISGNSTDNYWNASGQYGVTRSPPESPRRDSFVPPVMTGRRHSSITPEMIERMQQRRASLDKLNVDKVAPWMYLYDFEDKDEKVTSD